MQDLLKTYKGDNSNYECIKCEIQNLLDELENVLDETKFFRVNRQFVISSDYIKNIHTSPNYKVDLDFQPNEEISVSRERVKDFKDWLAG